MTINDLKQQAEDLGLELYQIRGFGKLSAKKTWEDAIAYHHEKLWRDGELQTEFACPIAHSALNEGELCDPTYGYEYLGADARGLPLAMRNTGDDAEDDEIYLIQQPKGMAGDSTGVALKFNSVHFSQTQAIPKPVCAIAPKLKNVSTEPSIEVDAKPDDFGSLFRVWCDRKLLGTFYRSEADDKWVANPHNQEQKHRCKSPADAQQVIIDSWGIRAKSIATVSAVVVGAAAGYQDAIASVPPQQLDGYYASGYAQARRKEQASPNRGNGRREMYQGLELEQVTFPVEPYLPIYRVLLDGKTIGRVTANYLGLWGADGNNCISIEHKHLNFIDAAEALADATTAPQEAELLDALGNMWKLTVKNSQAVLSQGFCRITSDTGDWESAIAWAEDCLSDPKWLNWANC